MSDEHRTLQDRIERLEAKSVRAERITTTSLEVGQMTPYTLFDKHGAMAIVFAIFIQTAGAIWWASGISSEVSSLRETAIKRDEVMYLMSKTLTENAERITRIQAVQENVVKILDRIQSQSNSRGPNP